MKENLKAKILMCAPIHLPSEVPYSINPWMRPGEKINSSKAMKQWETLRSTYEAVGSEVEVIEQQRGLPDMVFAADQGMVQENTVVMSRFRHRERQPETRYYDEWFRDKGYKRAYLPRQHFFEGNGEAQILGDKLFVGHGWRSNEATVSALKNIFPKKEVIGLKINNAHFYHLDVAFFALTNDTAFYYPDAFSRESKAVLHEQIPNLIPLSQKETEAFAANSVAIGEHVVFQQPGFFDSITRSGTKSFEKKVKKFNKEPIGVDVSEFKKLGGGIHCLTNILTYGKT